jgi:hypothetical protein
LAKKKFGLEFKGFEEVLENYQKLGGNLKKITEECLEIVPGMINPNLQKDMAKHNSQRVVKALTTSRQVNWSGTFASISVGFKIRNGGLPSIFLMYGTARHVPMNQYGAPKKQNARMNPGMRPDRKLYNDIYGRAIRKRIGEKQEEILQKAIKKQMGG